MISIHAPARGATAAPGSWYIFPCHFNPRSRKGSDSITLPSIRPSINFNPRSRKGSDERRCTPGGFWLYFNPRSRKGSDFCEIGRGAGKDDFNPRSRKGSDRNYNQFSHSTFIQNYHFLLHCLPSFIPKLSFPRYLTILCAIFPVRIPHRFYVCFRFAPDYKISVWSAAVPRSTPICSTFVWYLFPR